MTACCSSSNKKLGKFNPPEVDAALQGHRETRFTQEDVLSIYSQFKAIAKGRNDINERQFTKLLNELNVSSPAVPEQEGLAAALPGGRRRL